MTTPEITLRDGLGDRLDNARFSYQMFNVEPKGWDTANTRTPRPDRAPKKSSKTYFNFAYPIVHNRVNKDAFTTTCCNQPTTRVIHAPVSDHPTLEMNLPWIASSSKGLPKTTDILFENHTENDRDGANPRPYRTLRR